MAKKRNGAGAATKAPKPAGAVDPGKPPVPQGTAPEADESPQVPTEEAAVVAAPETLAEGDSRAESVPEEAANTVEGPGDQASKLSNDMSGVDVDPENGRHVVYPEITVGKHIGPNALTAEQAKTLLLWETEEEYGARRLEDEPSLQKDDPKVTFGERYLLKDSSGQKVTCWNNSNNRPFSESWARAIAQDILNKMWRLNCETVIIGRTGQVLSGQHRLVGLVLAQQMRHGKNKDKWDTLWPDGEDPTLETLIAYGRLKITNTSVPSTTSSHVPWPTWSRQAGCSMTLSQRSKRIARACWPLPLTSCGSARAPVSPVSAGARAARVRGRMKPLPGIRRTAPRWILSRGTRASRSA
jgi:hypothetical protein